MSESSAQPRLHTKQQADAYSSPWSIKHRIGLALWIVAWALLWRPSPNKLCWRWRVLLLRVFGAKVSGWPFLANTARVKFPWHLDIRDRACVSPGAEIYNLGHCVIHERANVTQYVYLCGGTHDLADPNLPLIVGRIEIGADAFLGARAMILPGVTVGEGAVVGAGAVVAKDVPPWMIVVGNPAKVLKTRTHPRAPGAATPD